MSYYKIYSRYKDIPFDKMVTGISSDDVKRAIGSDDLSVKDLIALLSTAAEDHLEDMAARSHDITLRYFGRTIQLYTPMYLANHCENTCVYCGFRADNSLRRTSLSMEDVEREAIHISKSGLKHILILTGDSRVKTPIKYIKDCVGVLEKYFSSISIEIYPLTEGEYRELIDCGVDGLTIYQEVYDEAIYGRMHPSGPKRDYLFRLEAPERAARAGMRSISIGSLLGLSDWRREALSVGLHARYLQDNFPSVEVGVALPRLRPQAGGFRSLFTVTDRDIVQMASALRIFSPRLGIALSTREASDFRDNLIPIGITRISAGSTTRVGGHTIENSANDDAAQFEISDTRSVDEIKTMLDEKGYQAVFKDWMHI